MWRELSWVRTLGRRGQDTVPTNRRGGGQPAPQPARKGQGASVLQEALGSPKIGARTAEKMLAEISARRINRGIKGVLGDEILND